MFALSSEDDFLRVLRERRRDGTESTEVDMSVLERELEREPGLRGLARVVLGQ